MLSNSYSITVNCIDTTITEMATLKNNNADSNSHWDRNVTSYLWSEMPGDLPTSGWCMETNQNESQEISSLSFKARGCTPSVQTCVLFSIKLFYYIAETILIMRFRQFQKLKPLTMLTGL